MLRGPIANTSALLKRFSGTALVDHLGRTNFLVMGIGGVNHEGSDLTDSMIFASVNRTDKSVVLLSIPRDIWVTSLRAKINTAYHYGYEKTGTQGGILLAKSAVSEIINQPVDYVLILDFSTFEKAVDLIGGLNVEVDNAFTDELYPVDGKENDLCNGDPDYKCRYEQIQFPKGLNHMDGATALKFVRSRYSTDEIEGTDFGRSNRQEKVISAFITKLISGDSLRHPRIYLNLFNLFSNSTITDLIPGQYGALAKMAFDLRKFHPSSYNISQPNQLYNPPISPRYDNQWVLVPKNDDPQVIFDYVSKVLGIP